MSSNSPTIDLILSTLREFQERMESSFPLRHFTEFYDNSEIESVALREKANILKEFNSQISDHSSGAMIHHLMDDMMTEKVIKVWLSKNDEHWKKAESVMNTFHDALCLMFKASVEAELSLDPDMSQKTRDNLFEVTRSKVLCCYKSDWSSDFTNVEFYHEQKTKLEMKLDFIRTQIEKVDGKVRPAEDDKVDMGPEDTSGTNKSQPRKENVLSHEPNLDSSSSSTRSHEVIAAIEAGDGDSMQVPTNASPSSLKHSASDQNKRRRNNPRPQISERRNKKRLPCNECDRSFATNVGLFRHKQTHVKKYTCDYCPKTFSEYEEFHRHLVAHLDSRPVRCHICGSRLGPTNNLDDHILRRHPKSVAELTAKKAVPGSRKQGLIKSRLGDFYEC